MYPCLQFTVLQEGERRFNKLLSTLFCIWFSKLLLHLLKKKYAQNHGQIWRSSIMVKQLWVVSNLEWYWSIEYLIWIRFNLIKLDQRYLNYFTWGKDSFPSQSRQTTGFLLRTMASDLEVLILIPTASHSAGFKDSKDSKVLVVTFICHIQMFFLTCTVLLCLI